MPLHQLHRYGSSWFLSADNDFRAYVFASPMYYNFVDIIIAPIFDCAGQIRLENAEIQIPTGPNNILVG